MATEEQKPSKKTDEVELPKINDEKVEVTPKSFMEINRTEEGLRTMHKGKDLRTDIFNSVTFWPATGLIRKGGKQVIKHDDLMNLPPYFRSGYLWNKFEPIWKAEVATGKPSLGRAIRRTFAFEYFVALFLQTLYGGTSFVIPVIIPYYLRYIANPLRESWWGWVYTAIIFGVSMIGSFFYYKSQYLSNMLGVEMRSVLTELVYKKVIKLEPTKKTNSGQIVNLLANDTQFFADTLAIFNSGLVSPVQIIVATGLLWMHVGPYALLSIAVFFLLMPIAMWLGRRFGTFRQKIQAQADKRLKLTNELIQGIRIVKFYAWEEALMRNIGLAREAELKEVQGLGYNRSVLIFVMSNTTTLVTVAIFIFYAFFGPEKFDIPKAFAVLSLINLLKLPFFILPFTLSLVQQYAVTFQRISNFVLLPEAESETIQTGTGEPQIKIEDGEFTWDPTAEEKVASLKNTNIHVQKGQIHMVVGAVGSGKSTLANAIFGEVHQSKGKRTLIGSVAYVPQEAWIINATVKENILFGEAFDEHKYEEVLEASALKADLLQLPFGDRTEIGERGITLSGGQKQRVSIARALYAQRDIYIMDDPFSAVDSHVGKHLFEVAVQGYLKGKTILLITNQLQYLSYADKIYVLHEGKQVADGRLNDLKETCKPLVELLKNFGEIEEAKKKSEEESTKEAEEKKKTAKKGPTFKELEAARKGNDVSRVELKQEGLVSWRIYWYYIKAGGVGVFSLIILMYIFGTACLILSSWWLAEWTKYPLEDAAGKWGYRDITFFVWIYIGWLLGNAFFYFFVYIFLVIFGTAASRILHQTLLGKVVRAPTSFFDVTPVGRIINRFAKELGLVDALLPMQVSQFINSIFSLLAVFAAMAFGSPWVILAIVPACVFYMWFQMYYRHTSIEIQRLEALSRAPVLSHLAETMNGVTSIRAYGLQDTFRHMNSWKVDYNTAELHALRYCAGWFGLRLDWLGQLLVVITLIAITLTRNYARENLDVGFAGIALTYMSGITFILSNLNLSAVELETRMNSVERVKEYESLEQEAPEVIPGKRPPKNWPSKGVVTFKDYCLAYRKGENVLNEINCEVNDQDKVGIVGRTGAGKSTLLQALFRMVEPASGTIFIDGIDITSIGLKDLRSKLAIIPQDPVLFMGTVRYNLDPFGEHNDKEIWDALGLVRLKKVVSALPNKLDENVQEHGSNFSVGQRQLICMARALLRRSKVLLMDEATASVDINTDALIQKMVRKNFHDVTVLTIAHRLNTIMDSTRVMVLDKGSLKEYDTPAKLLEKEDSIFTGMVNATGPAVSEYLRKIAKGEITVVEALDIERTLDMQGSIDIKKSIDKDHKDGKSEKKNKHHKKDDKKDKKKKKEEEKEKEKKKKKQKEEKKKEEKKKEVKKEKKEDKKEKPKEEKKPKEEEKKPKEEEKKPKEEVKPKEEEKPKEKELKREASVGIIIEPKSPKSEEKKKSNGSTSPKQSKKKKESSSDSESSSSSESESSSSD